MVPVARFLRNTLEKLLKRFYEGPHPPARIGEEVRLFRAMFPLATPDEWMAFAQGHAENAYRSGFTRGEERAERDPQELIPDALALEAQTHDWSLADGHPLMRDVIERGRDPLDPMRAMTAQQRLDYFDAVGAATKGFRVVQLDGRGMPMTGPDDAG